MFESKMLKPMLLKEIESPFNDDNYLYELKYDGYRVIIYASESEFIIRSRNNIDITNLYPELKSIKKLVKNKKVIFDGEIIAVENGKPSFHKLQARSHLKDISKIKDLAQKNPVTFIAFDILYMNKELINEYLIKRKKLLAKFPDTEVFIKSALFKNGLELFNVVKSLGLEGIIAKEKNSLYFPSKRVDFWLKIKNYQQAYFYVHAYIFNKNKYSLYLGEYKNNCLYFVGKISVMPNNKIMQEILKLKKSKNLFKNYYKQPNFVRPSKKVFVKFIEKTDNGMLREPFLID